MPPKKQIKSKRTKNAGFLKMATGAKSRVDKKSRRGKTSSNRKNKPTRNCYRSGKHYDLGKVLQNVQRSRSHNHSNSSSSNSIMNFIGPHRNLTNSNDTLGSSLAPKPKPISVLEGLKFVKQDIGSTTEYSFRPALVVHLKKVSPGSLTQDDKEDVMIVNPSDNLMKELSAGNLQGLYGLGDSNLLTETLQNNPSHISMVESRPNRSFFKEPQTSVGVSEMSRISMSSSSGSQSQNHLVSSWYDPTEPSTSSNNSTGQQLWNPLGRHQLSLEHPAILLQPSRPTPRSVSQTRHRSLWHPATPSNPAEPSLNDSFYLQ